MLNLLHSHSLYIKEKVSSVLTDQHVEAVSYLFVSQSLGKQTRGCKMCTSTETKVFAASQKRSVT